MDGFWFFSRAGKLKEARAPLLGFGFRQAERLLRLTTYRRADSPDEWLEVEGNPPTGETGYIYPKLCYQIQYVDVRG
jgi:hypothetical protein